jgi:anti-sigma-K factor RskA
MSELHSLVAPYALDALNESDERSFEEHLALCERCREELAALREAAATLAYATSPAAPPPELKQRILEQARSERPNVVPLRRRQAWRTPLGLAAAAAAAVVLGLGVWSATRPASGNAFTRVLSQPGTRVVAMGRSGALAVAPDGRAALALSVPSAPRGKTYEAWVIQAGRARRAGTFDGGSETSIVGINGRVPLGAVVAVTVERAGGVDQPTRKPFVTSGATA